MNILAINFNHDGAGVILRDGRIAGYVNTERFSRRKKHPGLRQCDIENLLSQAGLMIDNVDLVQLINLNNMDSPDIPNLHSTTLKETWPDFWINGTFTKVRVLETTLPCSLPQEHHLFHAALAYYFSPFESGVSFACDPVAASAHFFQNSRRLHMTPRKRYNSPFIYAKISELLFGSALIGAGKLMALAPFGSRDACEIDYGKLVNLPPQAAYESLLTLTSDGATELLEAGRPLNASLAFHAQAFLEFEISGILDDLYNTCVALGLEPNLCLSGGTALNSVANQRCFERSRFQDLYVHPACGDDGTAIGAALLHWHSVEEQPKIRRSNREAMYSCRMYDRQIPGAVNEYQRYLVVRETPNYISEAAQLIAQGKVIGWFQGASEIGPRALGNRSILADPRSLTVGEYLNKTIKQRESFRPFAPSVLNEHANEWFGFADSPFMLRVAPVSTNKVPAIKHVDGTARFQTVTIEDNRSYYELISAFHEIARVPMILNTSFNGKGEPIVETPEDALNCMLRTKLDAVVFPNLIVTRASNDSL